jgi:hypothetical protein
MKGESMRCGIWAALLLGGCATVIEGTTQTDQGGRGAGHWHL